MSPFEARSRTPNFCCRRLARTLLLAMRFASTGIVRVVRLGGTRPKRRLRGGSADGAAVNCRLAAESVFDHAWSVAGIPDEEAFAACTSTESRRRRVAFGIKANTSAMKEPCRAGVCAAAQPGTVDFATLRPALQRRDAVSLDIERPRLARAETLPWSRPLVTQIAFTHNPMITE